MHRVSSDYSCLKNFQEVYVVFELGPEGYMEIFFFMGSGSVFRWLEKHESTEVCGMRKNVSIMT